MCVRLTSGRSCGAHSDSGGGVPHSWRKQHTMCVCPCPGGMTECGGRPHWLIGTWRERGQRVRQIEKGGSDRQTPLIRVSSNKSVRCVLPWFYILKNRPKFRQAKGCSMGKGSFTETFLGNDQTNEMRGMKTQPTYFARLKTSISSSSTLS